MRVQVEPFISTGLQPGVMNRNDNEAVLTAWHQLKKPLKRLLSPVEPATGLKPGANEKYSD